MIEIIVIILSILFFIWFLGFIVSNDLGVPTLNLAKFKRVLIIFPHPDDEVLSCGGLIRELHAQDSQSTVVILTKGEKGTPDASLKDSLKEIRTAEAYKATQILGVTKVIHKDFGDGELSNRPQSLIKYLSVLLQKENPDLIITYDQSGLYGHPDHIILSQLVTLIWQKTGRKGKLWYSSMPKRLMKLLHLPEHMANNPLFRSKRKQPSHKVAIGWNWLVKTKALKAYTSQLTGFKHAYPVSWLPLEFYGSLQWHEYFYEVKK